MMFSCFKLVLPRKKASECPILATESARSEPCVLCFDLRIFSLGLLRHPVGSKASCDTDYNQNGFKMPHGRCVHTLRLEERTRQLQTNRERSRIRAEGRSHCMCMQADVDAHEKCQKRLVYRTGSRSRTKSGLDPTAGRPPHVRNMVGMALDELFVVCTFLQCLRSREACYGGRIQ